MCLAEFGWSVGGSLCCRLLQVSVWIFCVCRIFILNFYSLPRSFSILILAAPTATLNDFQFLIIALVWNFTQHEGEREWEKRRRRWRRSRRKNNNTMKCKCEPFEIRFFLLLLLFVMFWFGFIHSFTVHKSFQVESGQAFWNALPINQMIHSRIPVFTRAHTYTRSTREREKAFAMHIEKWIPCFIYSYHVWIFHRIADKYTKCQAKYFCVHLTQRKTHVISHCSFVHLFMVRWLSIRQFIACSAISSNWNKIKNCIQYVGVTT